MSIPRHREEELRLKTLRNYGILDTPREKDFDEIVELAAKICGAPIALIAMVDSTRQWFKAELGLGERETPIERSICAHTIQGSELFEVRNIPDDLRFKNSAIVKGDPSLRFYAGVPLTAPNGLAIGTLAVVDRVARELTDLQRQTLFVLAKQVINHLELRKQVRDSEMNRTRLEDLLERSGVGTFDWNLTDGKFHWSGSLVREFDSELGSAEDQLESFLKSVCEDDRALVREAVQTSIQSLSEYEIEYRTTDQGTAKRHFLERAHSDVHPTTKVQSLSGIVLDVSANKRTAKENEILLLQVEEEKARLESTFAESPAFISVLDGPDLIFRFANKSFHRLTGSRDVLGMSFRDAFPDLAAQEIFHLLIRALKTGQSIEVPEIGLRLHTTPYTEPETRFVTIRVVPIRDSVGEVTGLYWHGVDITPLSEAKRALAVQRKAFRELLDEVPAHVVLLGSSELKFEFANRAFLEFIGSEEVEGKRPEEVWSNRPDHASLLKRVVKNRETIVGREAPVIRPGRDGSKDEVRFFDFLFRPRESSGSDETGIFVFSLDVTDRVVSDRERQASDARFRLIFENAEHDAFVLLDSNEHIVEWNPAACALTGWQPEEVVGKPFSFLSAGFTSGTGQARVDDYVAPLDVGIGSETLFRRKDGSTFWASVTTSVLTDLAGATYGVLKLFRDTSARIRQVSTLGFLRELGDTIFKLKSADDIIFAGEELLGRHMNVNRCAYGDIDEEGFISILYDWSDPYPSMAGKFPLTSFGEQVTDSFTKGQPFIMQDVDKEMGAAVAHAFKSLGIRATLAVPIMRDGQLIGSLGVHQNQPRIWTEEERELVLQVGDRLSAEVERARAERNLIQLNEALEERVEQRTADLVAKNLELEGFTYSVSHDLRAPLRAMISNAKIALEEERDSISREGQGRLERLAAAASKMGQLVDDLLGYARLGTREIQKETIDISELASTTAEDVARDRPECNLIFSSEPNLEAKCDPRLLGLALHNLIDNACKYSPKGSPAVVKFGQIMEGDQRQFFVKDQGIGFDMAYVSKLFQPFERLHRDEYAGTGIGLANVKRVIERHGGRIWAEGQLDRGATFFFILP